MNIEGWKTIEKCPFCQGANTCLIGPGQDGVWCTKNKKLHPVGNSKPNYPAMYERYYGAVTPDLLARIAEELRVDPTILQSYGLGYCVAHHVYTIPFRDPKTWKMKGFYLHKVDGPGAMLETKNNDHCPGVFAPTVDPVCGKAIGTRHPPVPPRHQIHDYRRRPWRYAALGRLGPQPHISAEEFQSACVATVEGADAILALMGRCPIDLVIIPDRAGERERHVPTTQPTDRQWDDESKWLGRPAIKDR